MCSSLCQRRWRQRVRPWATRWRLCSVCSWMQTTIQSVQSKCLLGSRRGATTGGAEVCRCLSSCPSTTTTTTTTTTPLLDNAPALLHSPTPQPSHVLLACHAQRVVIKTPHHHNDVSPRDGLRAVPARRDRQPDPHAQQRVPNLRIPLLVLANEGSEGGEGARLVHEVHAA